MPQNGKTFSKTIPDFGAPGRPPVLLLVRALLPILPVLQPHHGGMPAEQVGSVCRLHLVPLEQWRRRAEMYMSTGVELSATRCKKEKQEITEKKATRSK